MIAMQYRTLGGHEEEGEVWSPGPLHGTVWVLRHPDGQPVVVHVAKGAQVQYEMPPRPGSRYPREVVEKAEEIRRRYISHDAFLRRYRPPTGPKPTQAEVDAAQFIVDHEKAQDEAEKLYREHHVASTPVAVKRVLELAGIELPRKRPVRKATGTEVSPKGQTDDE